MKRKIAVLTAAVIALVAALVMLQTSAAGADQAKKPAGAITIQSWLKASASPYGLSATVEECFKLKGAIVDQGGGPTWTDTTYADKSSPAGKCTDWQPVGGFMLVPPPDPESQHLFTLYATHTMTTAKGQIYITFTGAYNLDPKAQHEKVDPMSAVATWVITGGTGAYGKLRGQGAATGSATEIDGSTWPYIFHTVKGEVYWVK